MYRRAGYRRPKGVWKVFEARCLVALRESAAIAPDLQVCQILHPQLSSRSLHDAKAVHKRIHLRYISVTVRDIIFPIERLGRVLRP